MTHAKLNRDQCVADVSARPAFTSIPLSRGWFLPSTPRAERISLTVTGIRPGSPFHTIPMRIDVAAEFTRWV